MAAINEPLAPSKPELHPGPEIAKARPGERSFAVDLGLELLVVFTIATSLIGLAATLAGVFHAPQVLLAGLLVTGLCSAKLRGATLDPRAIAPRWSHVGILLLVTLFFRLPAYHYVLGDQDEGIYTNIAQHIEHSGGVAIHDSIAPLLGNGPDLQTYVHDNYFVDGFLPGIYADGKRIIFQFYDLFPIWMALFSGVFGAAGAGSYALTFFAVLTVLFFYRLALLITRSHSAALIAAGLLAVNPLHAFFSKFPTTEVPTLAFSVIGFTLLAAYWSASSEVRQKRWLWGSTLAFLCVFTTRISGFMYVPFFVALAMAALIYDQDLQRRRSLQHWAVAAILMYAVSVFYGWHISPNYAHDIYLQSFEPLLGADWHFRLKALVVLIALCWVALGAWTHASARRMRLARWLAAPRDWLPGLCVLLALLFGLLKIYRLSWTARFAHDPGLGNYWHLAGGGWEAAQASSLWTLVVYLGPLLVLALLAFLVRRQSDPRIEFLRWFVAGFFVYAAVLQWVIPYGPYYARYLLSELVPYSILLVACAWANMRNSGARAALTAALFLSFLYAGAASAAQIGKNEDAGAYASLAQLMAPVDAQDLVLLQAAPANSLKLPLMYTFDRHVVTVSAGALHNTEYLSRLGSLYGDMFLVSPNTIAPPGFSFLDSVHFHVMSFAHTHLFPRSLERSRNQTFYLYRWDGLRSKAGQLHLGLDVTQPFNSNSPWLSWLRQGWSNAEGFGVWSDSTRAFMAVDPSQLPNVDHLVLSFDARAYTTATHPQQRIEISVDGQPVAHYSVRYPETGLVMQIPFPVANPVASRPVLVEFDLPDSVSPKQIAAGPDTRQLAIALQTVTASSAAPAVGAKQPAAPSASPAKFGSGKRLR